MEGRQCPFFRPKLHFQVRTEVVRPSVQVAPPFSFLLSAFLRIQISSRLPLYFPVPRARRQPAAQRAVSGSLRKGLMRRVLTFSSGSENLRMSVSAARIFTVPTRANPNLARDDARGHDERMRTNTRTTIVFLFSSFPSPHFTLTSFRSFVRLHSSFTCLGNHGEYWTLSVMWLQ